jgi:hypothetical protein
MSDIGSELHILTVAEDRAGESVTVCSTQDSVLDNPEVDAYVDDDGTVRQESNGACFNANVYEVIE